jgi:hypothetical protein
MTTAHPPDDRGLSTAPLLRALDRIRTPPLSQRAMLYLQALVRQPHRVFLRLPLSWGKVRMEGDIAPLAPSRILPHKGEGNVGKA